VAIGLLSHRNQWWSMVQGHMELCGGLRHLCTWLLSTSEAVRMMRCGRRGATLEPIRPWDSWFDWGSTTYHAPSVYSPPP
jgi:hypothetical protein